MAPDSHIFTSHSHYTLDSHTFTHCTFALTCTTQSRSLIQFHFDSHYLYNNNLHQTHCTGKKRKTFSVTDSLMNVRSAQSI